MPSKLGSATVTKLAMPPGVATMSVGSAPTGRKLAPGTEGSWSMTGWSSVVRSTTATSPWIGCVTRA